MRERRYKARLSLDAVGAGKREGIHILTFYELISRKEQEKKAATSK